MLRELSATGRMRFTIPPGIGGVTFGQVLATADPTALASLALRPLVLGMMEDLLSDYPAPSFFDARGEALAPFQVEHVDVHQQDNRITLYGNFPS